MRKADVFIPWKSCRELDIMVIFRDYYVKSTNGIKEDLHIFRIYSNLEKNKRFNNSCS
jgi:hypothetical protein